MSPLALAAFPAATLPLPTAFAPLPKAEPNCPLATAFGPNAALLTAVAWTRKPTATAKSLVAEDEVPMAMLPCPQSMAWLPPAQGCVASAVWAKASGPMAIEPMAPARAGPASESLIPTAANPGAWPFPRVSASPGLETNDCTGTIAPTASSRAIWLVDMRDMVTPLRLSPIERPTPAVRRCKRAVVRRTVGRTKPEAIRPRPQPATTDRCHARVRLLSSYAADVARARNAGLPAFGTSSRPKSDQFDFTRGATRRADSKNSTHGAHMPIDAYSPLARAVRAGRPHSRRTSSICARKSTS